jgi:hypothetical protein
MVGPLGDIERRLRVSRSLSIESGCGQRRSHQGSEFTSGELFLHDAILHD